MVVLYYYWLTAYNLWVPYGICVCVCEYICCVCVCKHIGAFPLKWRCWRSTHIYQVGEAAQSTDSSLCYSSGSHQLVGFWSKSLSRVKGGGLSFASLRWGTYENGLEIYLREICLFSLIYLFIHIYTINIIYTYCISVLIWALI